MNNRYLKISRKLFQQRVFQCLLNIYRKLLQLFFAETNKLTLWTKIANTYLIKNGRYSPKDGKGFHVIGLLAKGRYFPIARYDVLQILDTSRTASGTNVI